MTDAPDPQPIEQPNPGYNRCLATIEGPIVKDRGRSRPLWRRGCRRYVKAAGERCYQHRSVSG